MTDAHEHVGPATGRTCRSIVSGVMALAVRHGAVTANPTRELEGCRRGRGECLVRCPRRSALDGFGLLSVAMKKSPLVARCRSPLVAS